MCEYVYIVLKCMCLQKLQKKIMIIEFLLLHFLNDKDSKLKSG